ncbi:MAG: hypothetical protein QX199_09630 [Methylococcaceae bacterium]
MNIYEMYTENGDVAGFWVKHKTWKVGTSARVLLIDGLSFGRLKGKAPYFVGNPPVLCEFYVHGKLENSSMLLPDADTDSYYRIDDLDGVVTVSVNDGVIG